MHYPVTIVIPSAHLCVVRCTWVIDRWWLCTPVCGQVYVGDWQVMIVHTCVWSGVPGWLTGGDCAHLCVVRCTWRCMTTRPVTTTRWVLSRVIVSLTRRSLTMAGCTGASSALDSTACCRPTMSNQSPSDVPRQWPRGDVMIVWDWQADSRSRYRSVAQSTALRRSSGSRVCRFVPEILLASKSNLTWTTVIACVYKLKSVL